MRVLSLTSLFPSRARPYLGLAVHRRLKAIAKLCELRVVALRTYGGVSEAELVDGIHIVRPRWRRVPKASVLLDGYLCARAALRAVPLIYPGLDFQVIDAHWVYPDGFAASIVAARLRKPLVLTARGTDVNQYCFRWPVGYLARRAIRSATHLVAVSSALRERMIEAGAAPERVSVIPNGVDTQLFHPADRQVARAELGLGQHEQVLFSAGALVRQKGFDALIEGLARVRDGDLRLYIAGSGPRRARLERLAGRLGLAGRVKLLGSLAPGEMARWYQAADLFVFGSWREGCPNVVLEALACGTPVVATRVGGTPELVREGRDGLLFEPRSPDAFAQALLEALSRTWDHQAIAQRAAQRSWDNVARECLELFERVLREHNQ